MAQAEADQKHTLPPLQDFQVQRVKVYRLNNEGLWDDRGTGHVSVEYMEVCPLTPVLFGPQPAPRARGSAELAVLESSGIRDWLLASLG